MIECAIGEADGVMAIFTGICALNMIGRFTNGNGAVMATATGAIHFGMVDPGNRRPGC